MTAPLPPAAEPGLPADNILDTAAAGPAAIRGSILRSGAYVIGILLSLVSAPLLVRHLGVAGYGRYVLVNTIVVLFAGLVDAGLLTIAQREYVVRSGEDREHTMRDLLGLRLVLTGSAVAVAIGFTAVAGYGSTLVIGAVLCSTGLLIVAVQHMATTPLIAGLRMGVTSALDILSATVTVALVVVLVVLDAPLLAFLGVGAITASMTLAITLRLVRGQISLRPRFDRAAWKTLLKDSLPYVAAAAITALYFRLALVILSQVSSAFETGIYATGFRLLEVVLGVPGMLISAAFPVLAHAADTDDERLRYQIGRMWEVALIVGVWFVVAIELLAPFGLEVLAGAQGDLSVPVLRVQAPAVLATFFAVASAFPLLALRRHKEVLVANAAALVVGVVGTALLAPPHGAVGTAAATLMAEVVLGIAMTIQLHRVDRAVPLPLRTLPVVLLAAGTALLLLLAPIPSVLQGVIGTVVFFGVLGLLGRIPVEVLEALRLGRRRGSS